MPSWEGFATWLKYEFLFVKLAVAGAVLYWVVGGLLDFLRQSGLTPGQLVLYTSGTLVLASVVIVWWLGRGNR